MHKKKEQIVYDLTNNVIELAVAHILQSVPLSAVQESVL